MTAEEMRRKFAELMESIEDPVLLQYLYAVVLNELNFPENTGEDTEDELNLVFEPGTKYRRREKFVIELPEELKKELLERLEDVHRGRVITDEEAEKDLDRFFGNEEWKNEKD